MKLNSHKQRFILSMLLVIGFLISVSSVMAAKTVKDELDAAKKAKKTVFLVVTTNSVQAATATKIAREAQKQMKESVILTLNRDDKANSAIVSEFNLGSVPVPFIMVVGMNGLPAGGLIEKDATAEKLVEIAPSAKKAEALDFINQKRPVFVIAYRKSFTDKNKVKEICKSAVSMLNGKPAIVEVNMDDPQEKALLTQIGADFNSKSTVVVVTNSNGQVMGNFSGIFDSQKLATAATSVPKSSGCCPSGSSKGCGK